LKYGLKKSDRDSINLLFAKYDSIEKVLLYGSRAKGNYYNGSDIDMVLIGKNLSLSTLFNIEIELDELMLPYKIDLSIFDKIENLELLEHIKRIGKFFYKKKNT